MLPYVASKVSAAKTDRLKFVEAIARNKALHAQPAAKTSLFLNQMVQGMTMAMTDSYCKPVNTHGPLGQGPSGMDFSTGPQFRLSIISIRI